MIKTKISYKLEDFPEELHDLIRGHELYDSSCHSSAKVYYVDSGYYIKIDKNGALQREADLVRQFHKRGLGVECICYFSLEMDYLVTKSAVGEDAIHWLDNAENLCRVMAETLRYLHNQPIDGMPVSLRLERYLATVKDYNCGCYDDSAQMKHCLIKSKDEAWNIMQNNKHRLKQDTLIHGDFCLPNIILYDGKFSSLIDFNLAGIGDRHIDIYWAIWSLKYNLGTDEYTDLFLDLYGRDNFEEDMLNVIAAFEVLG